MMSLRPYQQAAVDAVFGQWDSGVRKTLVVLPTGTGKTITFASIAEELVRRGLRVLIMAHRGELLDQAADKIKKATGLGCSVEKAEQSCLEGDSRIYRITVASVQTMAREKRIKRFPPDYFDVIIVDEAHHILSPSYQFVTDYYKKALILGVTATADRGDSQNLGKFFDSLAYEYPIAQAIADGYLAPIKALTIPLKIDMTSCSSLAGDYKVDEIGSALDPYLEQIADQMLEYCTDKKTIVFLPLIATSRKFMRILNRKGFHAAEVNGESEDRTQIISDFERGKYNVLCNSMLLTEGFDCPAIDCVIILRPTKVRALYAQMVGRGTRIAPGKDSLLLLDFLWATQKHDLCRPACILTDDKEVQDKMTEKAEAAAIDGAVAVDLMDEVGETEKDVQTQREEALAAQIRANEHKKKGLIDPIAFESMIAYEYQGDELQGAADKRDLTWLEDRGIYAAELDKAHAKALRAKLTERWDNGLATPKQVNQLKKRGFQAVETWSKQAATRMITMIAENCWRVPSHIDPKTYCP